MKAKVSWWGVIGFSLGLIGSGFLYFLFFNPVGAGRVLAMYVGIMGFVTGLLWWLAGYLKLFERKILPLRPGFVVAIFVTALVALLNTIFPHLRFESPRANHDFMLALLGLLPCIAIVAVFVRPRVIGIPVALLSFLLAPYCALGLWVYEMGDFSPQRPCSDVWQGPIHICAYELDGGSLFGVDGLEVRQERRIIPGLLIVRDIFYTQASTGGKVSLKSPGVIHIEPGPDTDEGVPTGPVDIKLRGFLSAL